MYENHIYPNTLVDKIETRVMSNKERSRQDEKPSNGALSMALLAKAVKPEAEWEDKDEFLDAVYWLRQLMGVIQGLIWGLLPLKGFLGLVLFFVFNLGLIYLYYNTFQKVDDEDYGGPTEILKEGTMTSFATFLVTWIILYSSLHTDL
ncbi:hypothetical protein FSP39_021253 [Pinctada imbricata]|uniref:Uncharacterized protein n=1 Tax=Pinctada imbricata TaxID=66713 RepID=A0AA88XLR4_PINIB|nr:hypothetical protein FSP39_021253 [Pinctada imbricata]